MSRCKDWSSEDDALLRAQWKRMTSAEIAKPLGRSRNSIISRARSLGLPTHTRAEISFKVGAALRQSIRLYGRAPPHRKLAPRPVTVAPPSVKTADPCILIAQALLATARRRENAAGSYLSARR